ncbi:MAG: hypothetical protein A3J38_07455 [Gammaproteobacteria bacterium RIFCSPHIGHO2_12_FULL_45_9]|nr:MAG: hypothetical protein A3J38_07455 [Gammaproteobacteria bacterium RIFCSPHIGHO2_12_FULL_45_9]
MRLLRLQCRWIITLLGTLACLAVSAEDAKPTVYLQVILTGIKGAPANNVNARIKRKLYLLQEDHSDAAIYRFYDTLPKEITAALEPFGLFHAVIKSKTLTPPPPHSQAPWKAHFIITPNERVRFSDISVTVDGAGNTDPTFQALLKNFPIKTGQAFSADHYQKGKNALVNLASSRGYFKAKFTETTLVIDVIQNTATVHLRFDTGPRYNFGITQFAKTPFDESFLERYLYYKPGDPYDSTQLQATKQGLETSNYFQRVVALPEPNGTEDLGIPITIDLSTQAKRVYSVGAGYGTDTGPRLLLGMDYRWVNSQGSHFNTILRASPLDSALVFNYFIPGTHPDRDSYIFTVGATTINQASGKADNLRGGATYQTFVNQWQFNTSLTMMTERYQLTGLPNTDTYMLYPMLVIQRTWLDDPLDPHWGYNVLASIAGGAAPILSKTSFAQGHTSGRFILSPIPRTRVLLRGELGYTAINDIDNLPLSLDLFAGGSLSARGFRYNSLGPGKEMYVTSAELQEKIYGGFYIAGFIDVANVSDTAFTTSPNVGVGPAIVWSSPLGVFELSVANAITSSSRPWMIQFSMGQLI